MKLLGINAFHGASSAAILDDGNFVCGVEEERLNRTKHWAGFPEQAIRAVLSDRSTALGDIEHVAISRNPGAHFLQKALFALRNMQGLDSIKARLANIKKVQDLTDRPHTIATHLPAATHHA